MKRLLLSVLIASLTVAGVTPPPAVASEPLDTSLAAPVRPGTARTPTVVVNDSKIRVASGTQPSGPQTFAIDSGKIYMHDDAGNAIRVYSLAGQFLSSIKLPTGLAISDLAVRGAQVIVLNIYGGLEHFKLTGSGLVKTGHSIPPSTSPNEPDAASLRGHGVRQIAYFGDQLFGLIGTFGQQVLTEGTFVNKPVGTLTRPGFISESGNSLLVKSVDRTLLKKFTVPNEPVQAFENYRDGGHTYFTVEDSYETLSGTGFDTWVLNYTNGGLFVASYTLASQAAYRPTRDVVVYGNDVYQLRISENRAQILRLSPDDPSRPAVAKSAELRTADATTTAAPPKKTLKSVLARARAMATVKWTYSKKRHGLIKDVPKSQRYRVLQAPQLKKVKTSTAKQVGYPYAWGGYDTDITSSNKRYWKSFPKSLKAKRMFASNINGLRNKPEWVPNTAGVDCSGFISSVFKMGGKRGTHNILDKAWFKGFTDLKKAKSGDVLNHVGNHVVLMLRWANSEDIWVVQSTTTGVLDAVQITKKPIKYYIDRGYTGGRYRNWRSKPKPPICAPRCVRPVSTESRASK